MAIKIDGISKEAVLDEKKVNDGIWVHFNSAARDEQTGQPIPMYLNGDKTKPQRGLVRSYRCKALKDAETARQKEGFTKFRLAKKKDKDGVIAESSLIPPAERFGYLLVALENFSSEGGIQVLEPSDAAALFDMTQLSHIVEQVNDTAYEDSEYLSTAETEAGNVSSSGSTSRTPEAGTSSPSPTE